MGKKAGNDYRLYIEGTTPGTFAEIKGQQDVVINRSTSMIDSTTKDDGAYGTQRPSQKQVTINCSILPDLPDATGYTRLETVALAATQVSNKFQVRKAPYATGDVVFAASMFVGDFNTSAPRNDMLKVDFNLSLDGPPTADTLA